MAFSEVELYVPQWPSLLMRKPLVFVVGSLIGCALTYLGSLQGYAPQGAAGYSLWGIPFQWHSIGTGRGGLTIGAYRYVVPSSLVLDLMFWSALSVIAIEAVLRIERQNRSQLRLDRENNLPAQAKLTEPP